ncbi:MAG: DNA-processing protein DprA [Brachymonas sp.]
MIRNEVAAWLQLLQAEGVGNDAARRLLAAFGLPEQVLAQSLVALEQVVSARQATALRQIQAQTQTLIETTWQWLQQDDPAIQRRLFVLGDPDYPSLLLEMADPPLMLYAMGQVDRLHHVQPRIAMVGSRNPTPQGASNARAFACSFAEWGWTVVSGLGLGVDGAAHEGALLAGVHGDLGLPTIAVVGTGLDRVYPRQHRELAHRIAQQGVILSECALGTPPLAHHFPKRNRIIAGLSHGVLVVEAALQSGSLITARLAAEQGKEVFAIPGSIHAQQSRGCHALIRQGAKLVESAQDVAEELQHVVPGIEEMPATGSGAAPQEETTSTDGSAHGKETVFLLQALGHDPVGLDALLERTGLNAATLQARLLELELTGVVGRLPGGLFQRIGRG